MPQKNQKGTSIAGATTAIQTPVGAAIAGGFYAGKITVDGETYALIVSPKAGGDLVGKWSETRASAAGAAHFADGLSNTKAMAAAGSALATAAMALTIDGHADWYLPSRDELEIIYRHLKPSTQKNFAYGDGANTNSVPSVGEYTRAAPAQTGVAVFQVGGTEALELAWYWSSTQYAASPSNAWGQVFDYGYQYDSRKSYEGRARAVRRLTIESFTNLLEKAADQPAAPAPTVGTVDSALASTFCERRHAAPSNLTRLKETLRYCAMSAGLEEASLNERARLFVSRLSGAIAIEDPLLSSYLFDTVLTNPRQAAE
jgi:hypothetical protein